MENLEENIESSVGLMEREESTVSTSASYLSFQVEKEILLNGLRIVERATAQKGLQPVLANILFEADGKNRLNLYATDFDLTVVTSIEAQITGEGKITLPAKKLIDIVSRLNDGIINFELNNTTMTITSGKSKFEILGISANEFPKIEYLTEEDSVVDVDLKPFVIGIKEAGFAAASFESNNNLLSGVVCDINKNVLEIASTDGNRLSRARKIVSNKDDKTIRLIISAKIVQEFLKISNFIDEDSIKLYTKNNKIMIKSDNITMISTLMNGQYPQYNKLIPTNLPKEAKINVSKMISAIERVSPMVNEKTLSIKLNFTHNNLTLMADTPESGNSEDQLDITYGGEDISIAFNYRYLLDGLKNIDSENMIICMNTNLSATVIKPDNEEDFIYLIMPVQIR
ncbi:MAG: DNA polymerase III subunit beta [Cyanobacteria bacterium RUI128]|nr:DNA polymerase III subunit beta [Cyanobacteria bacterium RUI128]